MNKVEALCYETFTDRESMAEIRLPLGGNVRSYIVRDSTPRPADLKHAALPVIKIGHSIVSKCDSSLPVRKPISTRIGS